MKLYVQQLYSHKPKISFFPRFSTSFCVFLPNNFFCVGSNCTFHNRQVIARYVWLIFMRLKAAHDCKNIKIWKFHSSSCQMFSRKITNLLYTFVAARPVSRRLRAPEPILSKLEPNTPKSV